MSPAAPVRRARSPISARSTPYRAAASAVPWSGRSASSPARAGATGTATASVDPSVSSVVVAMLPPSTVTSGGVRPMGGRARAAPDFAIVS